MRHVFRLVGLLISSISVPAAEQLPIQFIDGAVCCQCVIQNADRSVQAHLLIDLGQTKPLVVSCDLAALLEVDNAPRLKVVCGGGSFEGLEYAATEIDGLDEFSRTHARRLNEIPVWGILGAGAFDADHIRLDLQKERLEYGALDIPTGSAVQLTAGRFRYRYTIEPAPGYAVTGMFTTADGESVFDSDCVALGGSESADFDNCRLGSINVREYTALRVRDGYRHELADAECMIGTGFWQNFVLTLDRTVPRLVFTPAADGLLSDLNEQDYFNAIVEQNEAKVAAYIEKYPQSRLRDEACRYLLDAAIQSADIAKIEKSTDRFVSGRDPKQAARTLLKYAQRAIEQKNIQTATLFLQRAKSQALKTQDTPLIAGRIQSYLGWVALEQKDWQQAKRHLFSALLTSPDDPLTNCLMGHCYQQQGHLIRAWARYLRAALAEEPSSDAVSALQKLQQEPGFDRLIDVEDACDFLDGHIFTENGHLTDSAKRLKTRCGGIIGSAIELLQEQAQ